MVQYAFVLFSSVRKRKGTSPTECCAQWGTWRVVGSSCGHALWIQGKFTWLMRADRETCMPTPRHLHILYESSYIKIFWKQTPRNSSFWPKLLTSTHTARLLFKGLRIIRHTDAFTLNTSVLSAHRIKSQLKAANNTNHISQHEN